MCEEAKLFFKNQCFRIHFFHNSFICILHFMRLGKSKDILKQSKAKIYKTLWSAVLRATDIVHGSENNSGQTKEKQWENN